MAEIDELRLRVTGDLKNLSKSMSAALKEINGFSKRGGKAVDNLATRFKKLGDNLQKSSLIFTAIGGSIGAVGVASVVAAGKMEQWRISFDTMLEKGVDTEEFLNKVQDFAAKTPFELPEVVTGAKNLLAFGIESKNILPTLKSLGDVSAGLGVPMERLILNFGQVKAQAKLTGREVRDFAIAGVPIVATLAKNLNKTEAEIQEMVSRGKIGFEDVAQAFDSMSGAGGRFANLMEKQSLSLFGVISNLKDNIIRLAISVGELMLPVIKRLANFLKNATGVIENLSPQIKIMGVAIIGVVGAAAGALAAIGGIIAFKGAILAFLAIIFGKIGLIVAILGAVVVAIVGFKTNFLGVRDIIVEAVDGLTRVFEKLKVALGLNVTKEIENVQMASMLSFGVTLPNLIGNVSNLATSFITNIRPPIEGMFNFLDSSLGFLFPSVSKKLKEIKDIGLEGIKVVTDGIKKFSKNVKKTVNDVRKNVKKNFDEAKKAAQDFGGTRTPTPPSTALTKEEIKATQTLKDKKIATQIELHELEGRNFEAAKLRIEQQRDAELAALKETEIQAGSSAQAKIDFEIAVTNVRANAQKKIQQAAIESDKVVKATIDSMVSGWSDGVADMILEGKSFNDVFKGIMKSVLRTAIKTFAEVAIRAAITQRTVGAVGGGAAAIGGAALFAAAPKLLGKIKGFAEGGIVTKPTLGVIGETGKKEAVIPLDKFGGFGRSVKVNVTQQNSINITGSSREQVKQLMKKISEATRNGAAEGADLVKSILARQNRVIGESV